MMRSLITASTGMEAQQVNIDTIANNIANANTTSFKRSRAYFHDLLYQTLRAPGQKSTTGTVVPGGIQVGSGTRLSSVDKMFTEGGIKITGRKLDFMVEGPGFFRVLKNDGSIAYSRDGHFSKDNSGRLVTSDGFPLVDDIVIPPGVEKFEVGIDGTVNGIMDGQTQELGQILIATFVNPQGLLSQGKNLYTPTDASGEASVGIPSQDSRGRIAQGQLETSNVNIVEEMVNMISGQRAYELNSKVIQTADQMLQTTNNVR